AGISPHQRRHFIELELYHKVSFAHSSGQFEPRLPRISLPFGSRTELSKSAKARSEFERPTRNLNFLNSPSFRHSTTSCGAARRSTSAPFRLGSRSCSSLPIGSA